MHTTQNSEPIRVSVHGITAETTEPSISASNPIETDLLSQAKNAATSEGRPIPLAEIKVDPRIQQRVNGTSEEVVADYAQAMRDGGAFPPPIVFSDGGAYHLADGFHRVAAYKSAHPDEPEIKCEVKPGDHEDALLFACGANATHGLPRTTADKERSVLLLLRSEKWSQWTDREIARQCNVSHPFVGKNRRHLETFPDTGQKEEGPPNRTHPTSDGDATNSATDAPAVAPDRRRNVLRGGTQYTMNMPKKTDRDTPRLTRMDQIAHHVQEISKLLLLCDRQDREMIRRNNEPHLDGWFGADGKLRCEPV
jgi:hypothetical protein